MSPSRGTPRQTNTSAFCETPEQISTPDEPPPSVHPALLADDDFRSVHIAKHTREFHRELCRRLEIVLIAVTPQSTSRKRKRGSDASEQSVSTRSGEHSSSMRRSDTQDSSTTTTTTTTATTSTSISTAPTDASKRMRFSDSTTPLSLISTLPFDNDDVAEATDLSWWRPLSPSPPCSPTIKGLHKHPDLARVGGICAGYG